MRLDIELNEDELLAIEKFCSRSSFDMFCSLTKDKSTEETYQIQNAVLKVLRQARDAGIDRYQ